MRLIDADALIESFNDERYDVCQTYGDDGYTFQSVYRLIEKAHTIDAEPIRRIHAEWNDIVETDPETGAPYAAGARCSFCGLLTTSPSRYCPDCGARMDGVE